MSGLDIFAWIVLLILAVSALAIFFIAGWVTLIFGFALWPIALIWAYVDVPASRDAGADR